MRSGRRPSVTARRKKDCADQIPVTCVYSPVMSLLPFGKYTCAKPKGSFHLNIDMIIASSHPMELIGIAAQARVT